jgi:diguanylate cyclase (GGDEF)-like protein
MEAESIVGRAAPALAAHREWVRNTYAVLVCRTDQTERQEEHNRGLQSAVTRWFFHETSEHVRRHRLYPSLVRNHRQINAVAGALFNTIYARMAIPGDLFEAFASALDRFDRDFGALLGEMRDMLRSADPLTGVCTRFAMLPRLEQERDRVLRSGEPCAICMVDLDHFKMINDTHGHPVGDTVLQTVAGHMLQNLRPYDQVYRYGGEEFLLMLPNTSPEAALPVVDRLRQRINDTMVRVSEGVSIRATASFGIAALHPDWSVHEAIGMADKALYAAKAAGRNRIRVWNVECERAG